MKFKKPTNDGWADKASHITTKQKEDGRVAYHGVYTLYGMEYRFHITEQRSGAYVMRGAVSPIDPMTGKTVDIGAREKAKYFEEHPEKRGRRCQETLISREIHCQSKDKEAVKAVIAEGAQKLYRDYGARLHRVHGKIARPNTINPIIAVTKHGDKFMELRHKNLGETSYREYKAGLLSIAASLPPKAMCKTTMTDVQKVFRETNASMRKRRLLLEFWDYCIDAGICVGKNPVPPLEKKKKSAKASMLEVKRKDRLALSESDEFHEMLMSAPTGPACGAVLMLDGGYSGKTAASFHWKDLIWSDVLDYVRVRYSRPDLAGATHNFTAPIFPAGALVLRARYESLTALYGKEAVDAMPIASQMSDPRVPCGVDLLKQHVRLMLLKKFITYKDVHDLSEEDRSSVSNRILLNSYAARVYQNCGLEKEEGVARFLLHLKLSDSTTDDHYASFTCEEAGEMLYAIMSYTRSEVEIQEESNLMPLSDIRERCAVYPETTRQRVGFLGKFELQPGDELIIVSAHGVTGSIEVRGLTADGQLRRKSPKRK